MSTGIESWHVSAESFKEMIIHDASSFGEGKDGGH